jgi:Protein of unknown function (DUF1501)
MIKQPYRIDRRAILRNSAHGFGALAFSALLGNAAGAKPGAISLHHPAKIKNVIFLFMDGGPSQVDTFDPKPELNKNHGKPFPMSMDATQFDNNGTMFGSPFRFEPRGKSGLPISELFPQLSKCADDLCVVRSMSAEFAEHSQACLFLHSGYSLQGRPSLGSWIGYGLGSENDNLPGYVVINGGVLPIGGVENFSSAFLPAVHQASMLDAYSGAEPITNITPSYKTQQQRALLDFVHHQDDRFAQTSGSATSALDAAIRNYETAFAMQSAVPELTDFSRENGATLSLYGVDSRNNLTAQYAKQCLLARRLVERGVRFVEITCVRGIRFVAPWDDHEDLEGGHRKNAETVDQPIYGLISDLKDRGLFDETLLVFAGEFGRTPFAQGGKGRDHNPQGFSIWLAGGGIRGGMAYGSTDELGYRAVENVVTVHDLHATILHLLGIDHERLTFRWGGRDLRPTDVHGTILQDCLT